jgi:hypothetical protein
MAFARSGLMKRHKKPAAINPTQSSAHPEKAGGIKPGLPDADSSKAKTPPSKERDARTAHDRDGNEEQPRNPQSSSQHQ